MALSVTLRSRLLKGSMLIFLSCLLAFPSAALSGAKNGLLLWFNQVLPSLLPFLILSTLFLSTGLSDSIARRLSPVLSPLFRCSPSGCYAVVIGLLAGLPVGAKTIAFLTESGRITKKEGQYLLPLCNNPSPLFLLGFLSVSVLKRPDLRYAILFIVTLSSILAAKILRPREEKIPLRLFVPSITQKIPFSFSFLMLDAAIEQAFLVLTRIGGYIILFSVFAELLSVLPLPPLFLACLGSFLEITTGSTALCALPVSSQLFIPLVTGFVTFGGLSTAAQTKSVLAGTSFPFAHYLITKAVAGLIAGVLTTLFLLFFS